jgi:hypothetical protein
MAVSDTPESVKNRISSSVKALKAEHGQNVFDPTDFHQDIPLSRTLGELGGAFAEELLEALKTGGLELLRIIASDQSIRPLLTDWPRGQWILKNEVFPFLTSVWADGEGLPPSAISRHWVHLESDLLRDLWTALVNESRQWYRPTAMPLASAPAFTATAASGSGSRKHSERFPKRATWLQLQLKNRRWNRNDIQRQRGPDRKTVQKLLKGEWVQDGVLDKLAAALSVEVDAIPRD